MTSHGTKKTPGTKAKARALAEPAAAVLAVLLTASLASADSVAVPASLQAKLTGKLALFDRAFVARAGDRAHVLVVIRPGDAGSTRFADELTGALKQVEAVGGLPHDESTTFYAGAASLAATVRAQHPAIVYLSAGFTGEARAIGDALSGVDVLTIAADPEAVAQGAVAGFDLISNQPKIVLNLKQAANQKVQLTGTVLKLAIIVGG